MSFGGRWGRWTEGGVKSSGYYLPDGGRMLIPVSVLSPTYDLLWGPALSTSTSQQGESLL
jgi:hypothetical protein